MMKSSWIGIGFSHHKVPSLSNTATRSSTGTASDPSSPHVRRTKSMIDLFVAPSRQLGNTSATIRRPSGRAGSTATHRVDPTFTTPAPDESGSRVPAYLARR
jgi:hypothetical protein